MATSCQPLEWIDAKTVLTLTFLNKRKMPTIAGILLYANFKLAIKYVIKEDTPTACPYNPRTNSSNSYNLFTQ